MQLIKRPTYLGDQSADHMSLQLVLEPINETRCFAEQTPGGLMAVPLLPLSPRSSCSFGQALCNEADPSSSWISHGSLHPPFKPDKTAVRGGAFNTQGLGDLPGLLTPVKLLASQQAPVPWKTFLCNLVLSQSFSPGHTSGIYCGLWSNSSQWKQSEDIIQTPKGSPSFVVIIFCVPHDNMCSNKSLILQNHFQRKRKNTAINKIKQKSFPPITFKFSFNWSPPLPPCTKSQGE